MSDYSLFIKLMFFLWGFLGIALHILKEINNFNKLHPDNRVKTPADIWRFITADIPGLGFTVLAYIVIFGIWAAFGQIHKYYLIKQISVPWMVSMLDKLTNPWLGVGSPFLAYTADSVYNKGAEALDREITKKLG